MGVIDFCNCGRNRGAEYGRGGQDAAGGPPPTPCDMPVRTPGARYEEAGNASVRPLKAPLTALQPFRVPE